MVTFHPNVDQDFDRIYDFLREKRQLDEAEAHATILSIYEDAEHAGSPPVGRFKGLTFHRGRNGYFIWFVSNDEEVQVFAVYHRREGYDEVIHERASLAV